MARTKWSLTQRRRVTVTGLQRPLSLHGGSMRDREDLLGITGAIVDSALTIHRDVGPGLLETVYEQLLMHLLQQRGHRVRRQCRVRLEYNGIVLGGGFRVDLLVEECVVVEVKSVVRLDPVFTKQLLTYLRLLKLPVGLLINFGAPTLKEGLHRISNDRAQSHPRSIVLTSQIVEEGQQLTALEGDAEARRRSEQQ